MVALRRLLAVAPLALLTALLATLPAACGGVSFPSVGIASGPEHEKIVAALATLVDTLGRGEYAAAAGLVCADGQKDNTEADLRAEFEPHPRPWKRNVTATSRNDASGNANLDLTPEGKPVVNYTFGVNMPADGSWQVCDVDRGSYVVDVD